MLRETGAAVFAGPAGFLPVAAIGAAIAVAGFAADIVGGIRDIAAGVSRAGSREPRGRATPDPRR